MFFLRMHASVAVDPTGARLALLLPVVERDPDNHRAILNELLVRWNGSAAVAFFDKHQTELRAGRAVNLELDRLRGKHDGQWHANATSVELAPLPPSWQVHAQRAAAAEPD